MVAYSFKTIFADQVAALRKCQTIRADRRRHARPGEPLQLFTGMRTRQCRKLVTPDPVCIAVRRIEIVTSELIDDYIASIIIDGVPLDSGDIEGFAGEDGFWCDEVGDWRKKYTGHKGSARWNMGRYWMNDYGIGRFEGVLIKWEPA